MSNVRTCPVADYDLNAIADKLATALCPDTWTIDGQQRKVTAYPEPVDQVVVPALVIDLDTVEWDTSMGRGADMFVFLAHLVVSESDSKSGHRLTRQLLSSGNAVTSLKDALEGNDQDTDAEILDKRTLGGLVSYAVLSRTRTIGSINFAGAEYIGATLEIGVCS